MSTEQQDAFNALPAAIQQLLLATERPFVRIEAYEPTAPLPPAASRFGGVPYLPAGYPLPQGPDGALRLLAQLNFAEIQQAVGRIPQLPERGVLQIFADGADDLVGADFNDPYPKPGGRYQVRLIADDSAPIDAALTVQAAAGAEQDDDYFPVYTELALRFSPASAGVGPADETAPSDFAPTGSVRDALQDLADGDQALFDKIFDDHWKAADPTGHKLFGYPFFTQSDPRSRDSGAELFLQIDSNDNIMWGDVGVANFFITPADLAAGRFDRLVYNWDCH